LQLVEPEFCSDFTERRNIRAGNESNGISKRTAYDFISNVFL
jgi:hypothetical protein